MSSVFHSNSLSSALSRLLQTKQSKLHCNNFRRSSRCSRTLILPLATKRIPLYLSSPWHIQRCLSSPERIFLSRYIDSALRTQLSYASEVVKRMELIHKARPQHGVLHYLLALADALAEPKITSELADSPSDIFTGGYFPRTITARLALPASQVTAKPIQFRKYADLIPHHIERKLTTGFQYKFVRPITEGISTAQHRPKPTMHLS